jgi:hypothetical protein
LSIILKEVYDKYILSLIHGRLFKIVSKHNIGDVSNISIDIFVDLATDLIQNYFYSLYINYKNNLIDNKSSYKLSDCKRDNFYLVYKFEEVNTRSVNLNYDKVLD